MKHEIDLPGCVSIPLAHYLKALGVVRVVSEQHDSTATCAWGEDMFQLNSTLDREGLLRFFLHDYAPTPVIAPWNGGSGFFPKDNRAAITAIQNSQAPRLESYRLAIAQARKVLAAAKLKDKPDKDAKENLLRACRNALDDRALAWCDAAFVLGQDGAKYPPLLGTGGNDGRLEFTNNFMQRLGEVFDPATGEPTAPAADWLRQSLFAENVQTVVNKSSIGQFFPGAAGGANSTSGFDGESYVNPWDYLLMIEGALVFAAASTRKLEDAQPGTLVYPFCVRQAGVGYGSAALADEAAARSEMWLPLWHRPVTLAELSAIFSEGRAQVGGRAARNGVDFARAVVTLGVDRGIDAFQRYGFQVRNGLAYFATPLERVTVTRNPRADLLTDIDSWLDRFRSKATATNPSAPASIARSFRALETSILDLCRNGEATNIQRVLIALGKCEAAMAHGLRWTKDTAFSRPIPLLRAEWFQDAGRGEGNTSELRLAAALASAGGYFGADWLPMRCHLEPVEFIGSPANPRFKWSDNPTNDVVWHDGDLIDAMHAVFARRLIRAERSGGGYNLPDGGYVPASLDDVAGFITGETETGKFDAELFVDLLRGLGLINWSKVKTQGHPPPPRGEQDAPAPSALYALLKLCFQRSGRGEEAIPLVPAIYRRAMQGDALDASRLAARRLKASGYKPAVSSIEEGKQATRRIAAALLFPITHPWQVGHLRLAALRRESDPQQEDATITSIIARQRALLRNKEVTATSLTTV